ncbi:helix-turn-helix domain-containing protein [Streptomyces chumphonensis]|uniref:helix-turn-helix domain-containing protein n=1 Tax=Streptomyces chumphonensis TaxID=1214925 RepID=UPI003D711A78
MTDGFTRLGAALKAAGKSRGLQQKDIAAAIGVGRTTLRNIERGDVKKLTPTIRRYAQIVGWTEDSPDLVLSGEEPRAREEPTPSAERPAPEDDLPIATRYALREGRLVETQTFRVPTADGTLTATIVVRGDSDRSPEELHKALLKAREQGLLIPADDDEPSDTRR